MDKNARSHASKSTAPRWERSSRQQSRSSPADQVLNVSFVGFPSSSDGRIRASGVFHRLFYSGAGLRDLPLFYHPGYLVVTLFPPETEKDVLADVSPVRSNGSFEFFLVPFSPRGPRISFRNIYRYCFQVSCKFHVQFVVVPFLFYLIFRQLGRDLLNTLRVSAR